MTKEEIKSLIKTKKPDIDEQTLEYFSNYYYVLFNKPELIQGLNINDIIDNGLRYATKIVFYTEQDEVYKRLGPDCKGLRDEKTKIIYIRKNLEEPLREITVYHEFHHANQTNPETEEVGINQEENYGRLIMEAQTQYFAEYVYKSIHNITFEYQEILSEKIRMIEGGTIRSDLHNYELYDSISSKICILLGIPKEFLVYINFLNRNDIGMNLLKQKYNESKEKYGFPYDFEEFMFRIDYIYCTDLLVYVENENKQDIINGKEIPRCEIHKGKEATISLKREFQVLDDLDRKYFLSLLDANDEKYFEFAKFLFSNETRNLAEQIVSVSNPPEGVGKGHK